MRCQITSRLHNFTGTDYQPEATLPTLSTVVFDGIPKNANSELVNMFFESKRATGGYPIAHIDYVEGSGKAVLTFADAAGL